MVEGILNISDTLFDYFWAGRYVGFMAIAGLGVAQTYIMLLSTVRQGLDIAMKAMIARAYGAGRVELANHIAVQALSVTIAFVTPVAMLGIIFTDWLLRVMGLGGDLIDITRLYMKIQFFGFGAMGVRMMLAAALQSSGDTMTPMKATTATRFVSLILAPILMFGGIPIVGLHLFPELGIPGLALAAATGHLVGIAWNGYALLEGTSRLKLTVRGYRPDPSILKELIRIGWPAAVTTAERSVSQLLLLRFVVPFGNTAIASYSLARRVIQVSNVGAMGFGRASGILVGQNLGVGNEQRAKETVRWAVGYIAGIKGLLLGSMFLFPLFVAGIFSQDSELMEVVGPWIQIMCVAAYLQATALVMRQSYEVAGDTMSAMIVTFLAMWVVEIPAAWYLSEHTYMGHYGVGVAIALAGLLTNILFIAYYFHGRWLRVGIKAIQDGDRRQRAREAASVRH